MPAFGSAWEWERSSKHRTPNRALHQREHSEQFRPFRPGTIKDTTRKPNIPQRKRKYEQHGAIDDQENSGEGRHITQVDRPTSKGSLRGVIYRCKTIKMEVAAGLEPAKTGFADQRLDRFGIATKPCKTFTKPCAICTQVYTQICTQNARASPIYRYSSPRKLLKPRRAFDSGRFARPLPYHLATAPFV